MNRDLDTLRREVETLRQAVGRRPGRAERVMLLGVGLLVGCFVARLPANEARAVLQDDKELVCKSLRIVGPDGKNTLTLGTDDDGGIVQLFGVDGKLRAEYSVANKQGGGQINLFDAKKQRTVFLGTDEDGGIMELYGVDGKIRTIVAVAPKQGGGLINLFDTRKKLRLVLEGTDNGAVIEKR